MALYLVPAYGSPDTREGVRPDIPKGIVWAGVYDAASHKYVILTEFDLNAEPLEEGADVGFDYSSLLAPPPPPPPPLPDPDLLPDTESSADDVPSERGGDPAP